MSGMEWRAALAAYVMQPGGHIAKKVLWYNTDYACIPLTYEGPPDDAVLYFVRGERERFGVVKLSQL